MLGKSSSDEPQALLQNQYRLPLSLHTWAGFWVPAALVLGKGRAATGSCYCSVSRPQAVEPPTPNFGLRERTGPSESTRNNGIRGARRGVQDGSFGSSGYSSRKLSETAAAASPRSHSPTHTGPHRALSPGSREKLPPLLVWSCRNITRSKHDPSNPGPFSRSD